MEKTLTIIAVILLLYSCKKEKPKQFSNWKINGIEYKSNNVEATTGRLVAIMSSHDSVRFDLRFSLDFFPKSGEWPLLVDNINQSPDYATIGFYLDTVPYSISSNNTVRLIASEQSGKASYSLAPTWFYRYYNFNDSILIEGTFNEP